MVELGFSVDGAARVEHAAVPTLRFALGVASETPVRSVVLPPPSPLKTSSDTSFALGATPE